MIYDKVPIKHCDFPVRNVKLPESDKMQQSLSPLGFKMLCLKLCRNSLILKLHRHLWSSATSPFNISISCIYIYIHIYTYIHIIYIYIYIYSDVPLECDSDHHWTAQTEHLKNAPNWVHLWSEVRTYRHAQIRKHVFPLYRCGSSMVPST
jgi:hypothetical protein